MKFRIAKQKVLPTRVKYLEFVLKKKKTKIGNLDMYIKLEIYEMLAIIM